MTQKKHLLTTLFLTFLKIGAFTFGGGYAMIPLIQREAVENHCWISEEDVLDILAIAESTPGVLAVNSATFIGYKAAGFPGSLLATLGVVLPSFFIISAISLFYYQFRANPFVSYAFEGIRAGVAILMISAIVKLSRQLKKNGFNFAVSIAAFILAAFTGINIILILAVSAAAGIFYGLFTAGRGISNGPSH